MTRMSTLLLLRKSVEGYVCYGMKRLLVSLTGKGQTRDPIYLRHN